jgi:hypothetical protein
MKICIELDDKLKDRWLSIKSHLEATFEYERGISVTLPDYIVFEGLLNGFENEPSSMGFPHRFTIKELKAMKKQE